MDATLVLSAIIFTLLAIVVATSLLRGSSPAADSANARGAARAPAKSEATLNGCAAGQRRKEADNWSEICGSSHDHWDVVKSEQEHPLFHTEEGAAVEFSSSTSNLSVPSLEADSSEASTGRGRRSFIGLSDTELLKCAFSYPQTEGATESPADNMKVESDANDSLKYVPGKARSHHLEVMMSKEELEEEQRVQREQLTAIFQLLKDNKETFGDMSDGDLEEQLRLYSI